MYVRTVTRKNRDGSAVRYVQLAHNYRDPDTGHSMSKVLYSFGREGEVDRDAIQRLVRSLCRLLPAEDALAAQAAAAGSGLTFLGSRTHGAAWVVSELWRELGIGQAIDRALGRRGFRTPIERAIFAMVANRCLAPSSKLAVEQWVAEEVALPGVDEVPVHQLYRAMDALLEVGDAVQEQVFFSVANLLKLEVDVLFFDTTSTYFEVEEPDDFRKRGHSKDHRPDLPQAVIGLAVTKEGIPVRCWVWPGNTADVSVIEEVRRDLREWRLGRVITVVDRGFCSEENLAQLQRGGGHYIAGERMRSGKPTTEAALSRPGRYQTVRDNVEVKEILVGEGEGRERYILVRNPQQATRDKARREELLAIIKAELDAARNLPDGQHTKALCTLVSHTVYGRWLTQTKTGEPRLDSAKVKADERLDGKYLLRCSDDTLSAEEIALGYKGLYDVEEAFRTLKQRLELRPVYHRLEDRIRAHVLLCWLGLVVIRVAENRCGETWRTIAYCLGRMHLGRFAGEHGSAELRTATTADQKRIFGALGAKEPPVASRLIPHPLTPSWTGRSKQRPYGPHYLGGV
jgi:hypothetical protein